MIKCTLSRALGLSASSSWSALKTCRVQRSMSSVAPSVCHRLSERGLVRVAGAHAATFLQGLITNDMRCLDVNCHTMALYALMLNLQGRVLYDLIVYNVSGTADAENADYLVECSAEVVPELLALMKKYKLRKKVSLTDESEALDVWAVLGKGIPNIDASKCTVAHKDPRLAEMGHRLIVPKELDGMTIVENSTQADNRENYLLHRYRLGVGEGTVDLPPGSALPLESNAVFLNGVSFSKGCYIGQELTARTHHTGVVRKRLMPVRLLGGMRDTQSGDSVVNAHGKRCGKLRGSHEDRGLALLRVQDVVGKGPLEIHRKSDDQGQLKVAECEACVPEWWPQDADAIAKRT
ncbi:hypothetical protein CAPTEDRAFT_150932 [Capitella teleta]|uniref:CAF17 C-terminal domain-containing protein n=1 Tax=Capitella teleta TaxID=283909 RepID=R7TRD5_CAPTE|nr:hypothetical protein CAPTEDRAFT_150932 [Capitella teleta]|eukprot:ELT96468.1 hypothetical protein CAPTEDRAFT_150932 [Capitella teleta]